MILSWLLNSLCVAHGLLASVLLLFTLSSRSHWVCAAAHPFQCRHAASIWELATYLEESVAISVQVLEIAAVSFVFIGLVVSNNMKENGAFVTSFFLTAFVFSVVPWALVLGFLDTDKAAYGSSVWISVIASLLLMLASCFGLAAIFATPVMQAKRENILPALQDVADVSLIVSLLALAQLLFNLTMDQGLEAKGCMIVVSLLSLDCVLMCTAMVRKDSLINQKMANLIVFSLSFLGGMVSIVGFAFALDTMERFELSSACCLVSVLSFLVVCGLSGSHALF